MLHLLLDYLRSRCEFETDQVCEVAQKKTMLLADPHPGTVTLTLKSSVSREVKGSVPRPTTC